MLSVLRALLHGAKVEPQAAEDARRDHFAFTITGHETHPFAERSWQLRHQHTGSDACYLALAEELQVPPYTCDAELVADGHDAEVGVFPRTH